MRNVRKWTRYVRRTADPAPVITSQRAFVRQKGKENKAQALLAWEEQFRANPLKIIRGWRHWRIASTIIADTVIKEFKLNRRLPASRLRLLKRELVLINVEGRTNAERHFDRLLELLPKKPKDLYIKVLYEYAALTNLLIETG